MIHRVGGISIQYRADESHSFQKLDKARESSRSRRWPFPSEHHQRSPPPLRPPKRYTPRTYPLVLSRPRRRSVALAIPCPRGIVLSVYRLDGSKLETSRPGPSTSPPGDSSQFILRRRSTRYSAGLPSCPTVGPAVPPASQHIVGPLGWTTSRRTVRRS